MIRTTLTRLTALWIPLMRDTSCPCVKTSHFSYIRAVWLSMFDAKRKVHKGEESIRNPYVRNCLNIMSEIMSHEKDEIQKKAKNPYMNTCILDEIKKSKIDQLNIRKEKCKGTGRDIAEVI